MEELLSRHNQALVDDLAALDAYIIFLGVGGKERPRLARMAKRAATDKRIIGVARFSDDKIRRHLDDWGVETIACDLLDQNVVDALPKLANVIHISRKKSGTKADKPLI